jgi:DNA-binding transcriptional MerR regulator
MTKRGAVVDKAPDAFRTISEVAEELDVPQHVLRFWESRFREIKPMKRGGSRRYYRPDDVSLLRGIRHLLYGEGYTIRGVQRILREHGVKFVQDVWQPGAPQPGASKTDQSQAGASKTSRGAADESDYATQDVEPAKSPEEEVERGRKLFSLLPSLLNDDELRGPPEAAEPEPERRSSLPSRLVLPGAMAREDLRKLQAALHELGECRRLLDAVIAGPA